MMKHRRLFNVLWRNFEIICGEIYKRGHHFAIEWPRACKYWKATKVIACTAAFMQSSMAACLT